MTPMPQSRPAACGRNNRRRERGSLCLWMLGVVGACVLVTGLVVLNAITLNSDARAMRAAMFEGLGARASTRVQLSIGPVLLDAGRIILHFVDRVPVEARLALASARGASVGVYSLKEASNREGAVRALASADAAMSRRGWSRIVAVANQHETVLVYTPKQAPDSDRETLRVCVGVWHDRELVVVSAKVAPAPLLELAARHRETVRL